MSRTIIATGTALEDIRIGHAVVAEIDKETGHVSFRKAVAEDVEIIKEGISKNCNVESSTEEEEARAEKPHAKGL